MKTLKTLLVLLTMSLLFACQEDEERHQQPNNVAESTSLDTGQEESNEPSSSVTVEDVLAETTGLVYGHVFVDSNLNGQQDPGEEPWENGLVCVGGESKDNCSSTNDSGYYQLMVGNAVEIKLYTNDDLVIPLGTNRWTIYHPEQDAQTEVNFPVFPISQSVPYPMLAAELFQANCNELTERGYVPHGQTYGFVDNEGYLFLYSVFSEEQQIFTNIEGIRLTLEEGEIALFQFLGGNQETGFSYTGIARCDGYLYTQSSQEPLDIINPQWDQTVFGWYWLATVDNTQTAICSRETGPEDLELFFNNSNIYVATTGMGVMDNENPENSRVSSLTDGTMVVFSFESSKYELQVSVCGNHIEWQIVLVANG